MTETAKKSPLRSLLDVRREEWPLALLMFGHFLLVIATFWVLKPIKKDLFVGFYRSGGLDLAGWQLNGPQAELLAKVGNMFVAAAAVVVFSLLARTLRRERLVFVFAAFFVVALLIYVQVIHDPGHFVVWSFYLLGDLYTTLMVATFFAFLNDSVHPEDAKRLYPPIVLGGVVGGAFGSTILDEWIDALDGTTWLWICVGSTVLAALLAGVAGRLVARREARTARAEPAAPEDPEPEVGGNPALAGARLVARSRYLLAIAAIVGLYEIVSTLLDFQFTSAVAHFVSADDQLAHFARVFRITNSAALIVQLFVTPLLMNRFPLVTSLITTPLVILAASAGFLVVPILWTGSLLNTADNAFSYSINQSGKEALYTPTTREEKYKAKAFLDMFVQRFAKALAVGVSLLVTTIFTDFSTIRWLSVIVVVLAAAWMLAARYAGVRFREMTQKR